MKTIRLIILLFPLGVVFCIGYAAALVSDAAGWVDNLCRKWFMEMWNGGSDL